MTEVDLPNFKKVSDTLYRGGQPTRKGFECLQEMGIKTIIDVRGNEEEPELIGNLDLKYVKRRMKSRSPSLDQAIWFLKHATEVSNAPVFLHCAQGSHRTGWLVAVYRVLVQGWSPEVAVSEMTADGTGFDNKYPNLIDFVLGADFPKVRQELVR